MRHKHKHKKNGSVRFSYACAYAYVAGVLTCLSGAYASTYAYAYVLVKTRLNRKVMCINIQLRLRAYRVSIVINVCFGVVLYEAGGLTVIMLDSVICRIHNTPYNPLYRTISVLVLTLFAYLESPLCFTVGISFHSTG